jgi:hypothetical protein
MNVCFFRQVSMRYWEQNVVTVNGVTYTAWDTLNVTNISSCFMKILYLTIHQCGIHLKLLL